MGKCIFMVCQRILRRIAAFYFLGMILIDIMSPEIIIPISNHDDDFWDLSFDNTDPSANCMIQEVK